MWLLITFHLFSESNQIILFKKSSFLSEVWFKIVSYVYVLWSPIHFEVGNDNQRGNTLAPTNAKMMREYIEHIQTDFNLIKSIDLHILRSTLCVIM